MKSMINRVAALMLVGIVFAACSDSGVDSPLAPQFTQQAVEAAPVVTIRVCKVYRDEAAQGTYTFAQSGAVDPSGEFDLVAGNGIGANPLLGCDDQGASTTFTANRGSTFSVTELAVAEGLATLGSVSVIPYEGEPGDNPAACVLDEDGPTTRASGTANLTLSDAKCLGDFYQITFKNDRLDEPPEGGQGCTPGYWRQPQHEDSWEGYSPSDLFSDVFERTLAEGDITLLQAVWLRGGGENALARHAVAALLNASSGGVEYDLAVEAVISGFQTAFDTGDRSAMNAQKDIFEGFNEQGCPLN